MSKGFWLRRFALALIIAGAALFAVQLLKGHAVSDAATFAGLWGAISATIFTVIGHVRYKRNPACMVPRSRRE